MSKADSTLHNWPWQIRMKGGDVILVDEGVYVWARHFNWRINSGYAYCAGTWLHRVVLSPNDSRVVDHKNRNKLDNRRRNLRLATYSENAANVPLPESRRKTSKYRGVMLCERQNIKWPPRRPWRALLRMNKVKFHLGYFSTEIDAAKAYDSAALKHQGEFAILNFPRESTCSISVSDSIDVSKDVVSNDL